MSKFLRLLVLIGFAMPIIAQPGAGLDGTVRITGTVRARLARGPEPMLAVPVYLTRLPDYMADRIVVNRLQTTDSSGRYVFDNLVPGRYRICPHVPRTAYLSPCDWDAQVNTISAGTGPNNLQVTKDFTLDPGTVVTVSIDDEDGELTMEGRAAGLEVTVQGPHGPVRAIEGIQLGQRKLLTITAPKGRPAQIVVKTAIPTRVDTDDRGPRRTVAPGSGLSLSLGQEEGREVRFFVSKAGRL